MKTIKISIAVIFTAGVLLFACNQDLTLKDGLFITNKYTSITPEIAGDIHTAVSEQVCNKLEDWVKGEFSYSDAIDELWDTIFIGSFVDETGLDPDSIEAFLYNAFGLTKNNADEWSIYDVEITDSTFQNLYDDITDKVDEELDSTSFVQAMSEIRDNFDSLIDEDELDAILEISKSSYLYWYDNYEDCLGVYIPYRLSPCQKMVVGGDIRGAISGVISSWWSGLGAIGGAVTGAMVGTLMGAVEAGITYGQGC